MFRCILGNGGLPFLVNAFASCSKNKEEGRTGDDILQKDPQEMRAMMQDRLSHVKA